MKATDNPVCFKPVFVSVLLLVLCAFDKSLGKSPYKILHLGKGESCIKGENRGVCMDSSDCASLPEDIKNEETYLDICTFDGLKPIVCCSPTSNTVTKATVAILNSNGSTSAFALSADITRNTTAVNNSRNIADNKCIQYKNLQFTKQNFAFIAVVGGIQALSQEFPHMVIIGYGDTTDDKFDWKCGGSLISERWILTAAHCYKDGSGFMARWARLGELDLATTLDFSRHKDYRIVEHVVHPDYKSTGQYNDVALFRLDADAEFSSYVRPICLNTDESLTPPRLIATGWGKTATDETPSDILLKITLDHIPEDKCNKSYSLSDNEKLLSGIQSDSMICAGSTKENEDTCQGDSGGPLQVMNSDVPNTYTQFGVTSFGSAFCGDKDKPGVYTRVSKYIPWIEGIVWPDG